MALRTLISDGVEWAVWDVRPASPARLELTGASPVLQSGWLCFESPEEKRRVAPIPDGWESWSDAELEACCRAAPRVQRRGVPAVALKSM
jgi:hypothetical protein